MNKWIVVGGSLALILSGAGLIFSSAVWREPNPAPAAASGGGAEASGGVTPAAAPKTGVKPSQLTCDQCETKECPDRMKYCDGFSGAKRDACNAVVECVRKSNCHARLAVDCYCGTADAVECSSGAANGACKREIELGLGNTVPRTVLSTLLDPATPGGAGMALMYCDTEACKSSCVTKKR